MIFVIHVPYMCCTWEINIQQIEETALLCPSQHTPSLLLCPSQHTPSLLLCPSQHTPSLLLCPSQHTPSLLLCPSQHTPSLSDMFICPARTPSKLLKWIPHASRDQGATKLASILFSAVAPTITHHGSTFSVLVLVLFMFLTRVPPCVLGYIGELQHQG